MTYPFIDEFRLLGQIYNARVKYSAVNHTMVKKIQSSRRHKCISVEENEL